MRLHVLMENTLAEPGLAAGLTAEHGLSLLVETPQHRVLFDAGQTPAFAENARRMGLDLGAVDIAVLSHGHYDHGGGLARFLELNDHAPVYLRRDAFLPLYNGEGKYIGLDASLAPNRRFVWTGEELRIDPELSLHACNDRPRVAPLRAFGLSRRERGALVPDDFRHEQYLLLREGERRILFSGCSHKGILNIVNWFEPDVLIGGFHFMKLDPDRPEDRACLEAAAQELLRHPTLYYTGHCTGSRQYQFLKERMGGRLEALSTGQTLVI